MLLSSYRHLLRYSALLAWGVTALPPIYRVAVGEGPPLERFLLWLSSFCVFGVAFWLNTSPRHAGDARRSLSLLLLQTVSGLLSTWDGYFGFAPIFSVLVAMQLLPTFSLREAQRFVPPSPIPEVLLERLGSGPRLSLRGSLYWVLTQTALIGILHGLRYSVIGAIPLTLCYLGFQLFVLFTAHLAVRERQGRHRLEAAHAELSATGVLLEDASRLSERLRIARDLHDVVGHHLTALSLNLEIATVSEIKRLEHLEKARALSKLLLADVRETVSALREGGEGLDLERALSTLIEHVPEPRIHLILPPTLELQDAHKAQMLLRCVQEIVTNAVRHAGATNLWIRVQCEGGRLEVEARDDGHGLDTGAREGNGLRGMRERLREVGGQLEVRSRTLEGTRLWLSFPL